MDIVQELHTRSYRTRNSHKITSHNVQVDRLYHTWASVVGKEEKEKRQSNVSA